MRCNLCNSTHKNTSRHSSWLEYQMCRACSYALDIFSWNSNYLKEYWGVVMFSNLIPKISRHLVYSLLEYGYEHGVEIINVIPQLPLKASYFISSLASNFDGLFYRLNVDLGGHLKVKDEVIEAMKKSLEDQGEFN